MSWGQAPFGGGAIATALTMGTVWAAWHTSGLSLQPGRGSGLELAVLTVPGFFLVGSTWIRDQPRGAG